MRLLGWMGLGLAACTSPPSEDGITISDVDMDGISSAEGDCNDQDPTIFPGADDIVGDMIDRNCDGNDGIDNDRDGDASQASGGADCNDEDPAISSEREEIGWDGIDQNCDSVDQYDFDQICSGTRYSCAVSTIGEIWCWGDDGDGTVTGHPTEGLWVEVDCGDEFACAREYDGSIQCWGKDTEGSVANTPAFNYLDLAVGFEHACALDLDSRLACWGKSTAWSNEFPSNARLRDLALGDNYSCGTAVQFGRVDCWGATPPETDQDPIFNNNEWIRIAGGADYVCGIDADQNLSCFSANLQGGDDRLDPVMDSGPYSDVDAFSNWSCAIREATELSCWGINIVAQKGPVFMQPPASDSLFAVGVGRDHACALRNGTGEIVCWGMDVLGETVPPDFGAYAEVP